jgi:hypothetical protein
VRQEADERKGREESLRVQKYKSTSGAQCAMNLVRGEVRMTGVLVV